MDMIKWRPTRDLFKLHNRSLLDEYTFPARVLDDNETLWEWNPKVDVYENDKTVVVKAELPGMEKDQIAVDVQGRVLTIKGERTADNEINEDRYYRRERIHGRFERAFALPAELDPAKIKAEYKDGVLIIEVPKPAGGHWTKKISVQ